MRVPVRKVTRGWTKAEHPDGRTVWVLPGNLSVELALELGAWMAEPHAGDFDDEDCFNPETDGFDRRKMKIGCPACGRVGAPLCSPRTVVYDAGWRWVGCDHREPYASHRTVCPKCKITYTFTTFTPQ